MTVLLWLGIFWTIYGVAGVFGIMHIPAKYRNKDWTKRYARLSGISWLMIGIPWIILYAVSVHCHFTWSITAFLIVLLSVPSIVFSICVDRKYRAKPAERK